MKTKALLVAGLIGAASVSAQAGVFFGFSFHAPLAVPAVTVALPAPVVVVPAASTPVVCAAPVVAAPPCPAPGYIWSPGYWSGYGAGRVWVAGCWRPGPARVARAGGYHYGNYGHVYGWHRW